MRPQAIVPLDRPHAERTCPAHRPGPRHLGRTAKWPDVLSSGQVLDWVVMVSGSTDNVEVDAWVLGTDGTALQRMETYRRLKGSASWTAPS